MLAVVHFINRTPTIVNNGVTKHEMLFGNTSNYEHLKVFGCLCYVKTRSHDKFEARANKCMFIGYPQGQKGWNVYNLETKEFSVSRDVIFYENFFPFEHK